MYVSFQKNQVHLDNHLYNKTGIFLKDTLGNERFQFSPADEG